MSKMNENKNLVELVAALVAAEAKVARAEERLKAAEADGAEALVEAMTQELDRAIDVRDSLVLDVDAAGLAGLNECATEALYLLAEDPGGSVPSVAAWTDRSIYLLARQAATYALDALGRESR